MTAVNRALRISRLIRILRSDDPFIPIGERVDYLVSAAAEVELPLLKHAKVMNRTLRPFEVRAVAASTGARSHSLSCNAT
jgi:hypothetical protein